MTDSQNPLLTNLRIPGVTYRLPSQGLFYAEGILDPSVQNGEVEVFPLTTIDEIVFSTPDKLLSGKAIEEVFARCVPQVLKPKELLAKDVDFLLVCLRTVSFGDTFEVEHTHNCENAKSHRYNVNLQHMVMSARSIDPTTLNTEYSTTLPNGQKVILKPLNYGDIVNLYQTTILQKTDNMSDDEAMNLIISTLTGIIASVDEVTDKDLIKGWITNLPLGWKRQIEQSTQKISDWGINFTSKQVCMDCQQEMDIQVTANPVSFFT
jgi:hypothetical protein